MLEVNVAFFLFFFLYYAKIMYMRMQGIKQKRKRKEYAKENVIRHGGWPRGVYTRNDARDSNGRG